MGSLSPVAKMQFFDSNGNLLTGGKLYTYETGTTTPLATYTNSALSVANANPIILDARGEAAIYLQDAAYRFVLTDSADATIWTRDGISTDIYQAILDGKVTRHVDSVASLKALTGMSDEAYAMTAAYYSGGSGGSGIYRYDSGSSATDNGGTVIAPNSGGGRWLLLSTEPSLKQFGCKLDGSSDDTSALQAAANYGVIYAEEGTCVTGKITIINNLHIQGRGKYKTIFKSKNGTNDHVFYVSGDYKLTLLDIGIDGNYANNPNNSPNYPCGVLVPVGSLHMERCRVTGMRNHAVHTGNTDYDFNAANYAHDCIINNNIIEQLTATEALGDCIRIHRTIRFECANNICIGGLSGIRSNYYCTHGSIHDNVVKDSYADVGVTIALSSDMEVVDNICTGHFQHGVECDGVVRGVVSGNTCSSNSKYGIFLTEYGPPSGSNYSGSVDGVSISNPTVMSNKYVNVANNTCSKNNFTGMHLIGQEKILVTCNVFSNNNTGNNGASYNAGVSIDGGTLGKDDIVFSGNFFYNDGYQSRSVIQANAQFQTKTEGNYHSAGSDQFTYGVRGTLRNNLNSDPYLRVTANIGGTAMSIVEDTTSKNRFTREINDTNAAGSTTSEYIINSVPRYGEKLAIFRFRNVDTMTSCDIYINLYSSGAFVATAYSSSRTGLGTGWVDVVVQLPDSLKSYNYNEVRMGVTTNSSLTGKIHIEEASLFTSVEI